MREVHQAAPTIEAERQARGPFESLRDLCRRCPFLTRDQLEWLALSGALDALGLNRREALWSLPALHQGHTELSQRTHTREAAGQTAVELDVPPLLPHGLANFSVQERFHHQWQALGFSPDGHLLLFLREALDAQGILPCGHLQTRSLSETVTVAGLIVRPHQPPSAGGTLFFTLEDETGLAHVTVGPAVYREIAPLLYSHPALAVTGQAQKRGDSLLLLAQSVAPLSCFCHPLPP